MIYLFLALIVVFTIIAYKNYTTTNYNSFDLFLITHNELDSAYRIAQNKSKRMYIHPNKFVPCDMPTNMYIHTNFDEVYLKEIKRLYNLQLDREKDFYNNKSKYNIFIHDCALTTNTINELKKKRIFIKNFI